jgi:hypothetical protein
VLLIGIPLKLKLYALSNKSMDARAKQAALLSRYLLTFGGLSGGFPPCHLNRSALS